MSTLRRLEKLEKASTIALYIPSKSGKNESRDKKKRILQKESEGIL